MISKSPSNTLVLVTGASGYVGSQCVRLLLDEGYKVRGTVRSLDNKAKVSPLKALDTTGRLELVEADLMNEKGWDQAVSGCDFVLHVASPFPLVSDQKCIDTAITGTMTVLRACNRCDTVRKVVLTSSCAAVNEGHPQVQEFDETSWSNMDNKLVDCYARSKTLAEKKAWEFVESIEEGNKFALTAINPTLVLGPMLIDEQGASISLMRRFLNKEMPAVPALNLACVDVRDVAKAHVEAMRRPQTDGERILVTGQPSLWFSDIAKILRSEFADQGYCIPRHTAPYFFLWMFSFIDAEAASALPRVNQTMRFSNQKAKNMLDIEFRDLKDSIIEMAYQMIERGLVKKTKNYKGVPGQNNNTKDAAWE